MLDGAIKIRNLIDAVKGCNQSAVAITDHGNMHGAVEFYQSAKSAGVKPIIGCEVYISAGSRHDKRPRTQGGAPTYHLTLLCSNLVGYRNLCRLVSMGYLEGFYFKPRIDFELLEQFHEGLICLSGCLSGELSACASIEDLAAGRTLVQRYERIFGDRFYLEVQPHVIAEQQRLNNFARAIGKEVGVPLVATNDCHYLAADDAHAQEVLMCISTGKLITDEDRMNHHGAALYLKSEAEMRRELPEYLDAVDSAGAIAARCNVEFDFSKYYMPRYSPPEEMTIEEHFAREAERGLAERFAQFEARGEKLSAERRELYERRLRDEIEVIIRMGFASYFLVVSDFVRFAKRSEIPVGPGRGSAAGALVAYALLITEIDPIVHNLLFERFLNAERISLPDIDVDFCIHGRDAVIQYVREIHGQDKVAQIVTFGTLKAKAAIKDVGRVLGLSYAETDRVAKLIPAPRQGFDYPLAEALKMDKALREYAEGEGKQLIDLALKLEGLSRHTSTHAAGIVVADRPVMELLPLMVDKDNQVVTQLSMNWVEKIGLVKFDFLGLKTLTVLQEAVRMIAEDHGRKIDLNALPLADQKTFKLIGSGRTIGIFQLESSGITDVVQRLRPSCFEDLVAVLALYRPGPLDAGMVDHFINRKHGREQVRFPHPVLEPILRDTYGIIVYQEQIMQIARDMAGYTLGEADILRRAMGKKKPEEMAQQRDIFLAGAMKKGHTQKLAAEVFDQMETFARYGFNRSHSVAYAMISYQTAYLKAHYPKHFMAALMTFEMDDTDKILKNLNECRDANLTVTLPNVNVGTVGFRVVDGTIVFGLAGIKGVGAKAVEEMMRVRTSGGPFRNLLDFCERVDSSVVNRRALESLIKAGAFDWTSCSRAELLERLEPVLKRAQQMRVERESAQIALFKESRAHGDESFLGTRKPLPEWPTNVKLAHEREALGFYLSGHPLEKFQHELQRLGSTRIDVAKEYSSGTQITVGGVITFLKLKNTKRGDRYATFVLEDLLSTIETIVWPDIYQKVYASLAGEDPVVVSGKLDVSDERRVLIATTVDSVISLRDRTAREAVVRIDLSSCTAEKVEELRTIFSANRGNCPVKLVFCRPEHSETVVSLAPQVTVEPSESLCNAVEALFGQHVITFR